MTDIFSLSLEELATKIKDAQLTSVDVCEKYIERINKFDKDIKAWAHFDKKVLLEKAAEADDHRRSGKPIGPLHEVDRLVYQIFYDRQLLQLFLIKLFCQNGPKPLYLCQIY